MIIFSCHSTANFQMTFDEKCKGMCCNSVLETNSVQSSQKIGRQKKIHICHQKCVCLAAMMNGGKNRKGINSQISQVLIHNTKLYTLVPQRDELSAFLCGVLQKQCHQETGVACHVICWKCNISLRGMSKMPKSETSKHWKRYYSFTT